MIQFQPWGSDSICLRCGALIPGSPSGPWVISEGVSTPATSAHSDWHERTNT